MISPQSFIAEYENEPYEKLLKVRDKLIQDIRYFEKHKNDYQDDFIISPSPYLQYRMNIESLIKLILLMNKSLSKV